MKTIPASVSSQGQVTLPVDVRRRLGLADDGHVNFVLDDSGVRLEPARFTLKTVRGSVPGIPGTSADFDDEIEEAMAIETARLVHRSNEP